MNVGVVDQKVQGQPVGLERQPGRHGHTRTPTPAWQACKLVAPTHEANADSGVKMFVANL